MFLTDTANTVTTTSTDLWYTVWPVISQLILALLVFVIAWIVGVILYRIIVQIVKILRLDDALRSAGVTAVVKDAGINLDIGRFLGTLVKWFVMIVGIVVALEIIGLTVVTLFLQQVVLLYLPQVIVAVLILILAAVVADAVRKIVTNAARAAGAHAANLAGNVAKWAIWLFAVLAALTQLGIAPEFLQTLFTGVIVALALAFGLSFGLGGKDAAARTIERIRSEIAH